MDSSPFMIAILKTISVFVPFCLGCCYIKFFSRYLFSLGFNLAQFSLNVFSPRVQDGVMVLSATHRYKKKYVTSLLYKPI